MDKDGRTKVQKMLAAAKRFNARRSAGRSGIIPVRNTLMEIGAGPLTEEDRARIIHEMLARLKKRKEELFTEFIAECRNDPRFLDRAIKELKPLRGPGYSAPPPGRDALVDNLLRSLQDYRPKEICETIAITLGVSDSHARRLYDAARKRCK